MLTRVCLELPWDSSQDEQALNGVCVGVCVCVCGGGVGGCVGGVGGVCGCGGCGGVCVLCVRACMRDLSIHQIIYKVTSNMLIIL